MEEIEYLEEYEDLVLPALNSATAEAATSSTSFETNTNRPNQKNNEDDSSSSLDQDIFNCLFDDNSDDEDYNDYQNSDRETALRPKTASNETFVALENKIGNTVIEKVEISRQDPPKKANITPKIANKTITSTTTAKPKGFMTKTSGTTIKPQISTNKTKSVATVRPTVQSQLTTNLPKKANILAAPASSATKLQKPSTSTASKSYRTIRFPVVPPKSSVSSSAKNLNNKIPAASSLPDAVRRPATIVRPEKIISKDPLNDPLDLDDISEANSVDSFSDISGETYNSISDFGEVDSNDDEFYCGEDEFFEDDDEEVDDIRSNSSNIIELSNDSSGAASHLEDLRAPTPSPVLTDDSDTSGSSSGFILSKRPTIKPYSHPAIIESVLRKGEKPKLLELLHKFNLLEDPVENIKEDNIIIDITTSRENLVENTDTQQQVTSSKQTSPSTNTIDPANNKSLTLNPPNLKQTINKSKKTNKKRKKKSLTNMDATNDYSTDSDLSAVEELLEESYAEAMKRVSNEPVTNQHVAAEIVIGDDDDVTITEANKQKLPKAGVVIAYDDKRPEMKENAAKTNTEDLKEQNETISKEDQPNIESKKLEESVIKEPATASEPLRTDVLEKKGNNRNDTELKTTSVESQQDIISQQILEADKTNAADSAGNRKKKRFRNLVTPDPTEKSSDEAKSVDDFAGFDEEAKQKETVQNLETNDKPQPTKDSTEKPVVSAKISEKNLPSESFKSPSKSHQSLKEKSKESKSNSSLDSREKSSSKHSKSRHSSESSKDRSSREGSREGSRDKCSRESSKDHSRDNSKDRPKHSSRDKDHHSKHHYRDPRRSCDSKDSSKSRESSKSRDSKEAKDSSKHSTKKDPSIHDSKCKSHERKTDGTKLSNVTEKHSKEIVKSSNDSKSSNESSGKDAKEHKSSIEKCDKKSSETVQNTSQKEKDVKKTTTTNTQDSKYTKDMNKSSSSPASRDSSKHRKSTNKSQDLSKNGNETKFSEKPKAAIDPNKTVNTQTQIISTASKNDKVENTAEQQKTVSKTSPESACKDKELKATRDKNTKQKNILQNPAISSSKTAGSKGSSNSPQKASKTEIQVKNDKTTSEKKELDKTPNKSNSSQKTKVQTPLNIQSKETTDVGTKTQYSDGSSKKPSNSDSKVVTKSSSSENIQKTKTPDKTHEVKSKSTTSDIKRPKETIKSLKELESKKMSNSPKRSLNSKQEETKNSEKSIKNVDTIKDKQLEDAKGQKAADQKCKEKIAEDKKLEVSKEEKYADKKSEEIIAEDKNLEESKQENSANPKPKEKSIEAIKDKNLKVSKGGKSTNQISKGKATEAVQDKKLEDFKGVKSANQRSEEKSTETKIKDNQTRDSTAVAEKSVDIKNESKISESKINKTDKNEAEKRGLTNITQNSNDKKKIVSEKNEPKKDGEEEDSASKNNVKEATNKKSNTSIPPQGASKIETKKAFANITAVGKETQHDTEKNISTKSATPSSKAQKTNVEKTPQIKQVIKEQKSTTTTPTSPSAQPSSNKSSTSSKKKSNENIATETKSDSKATVSTSKTSKKPQSTISKTKSDVSKTIQKIQNTSKESKSIAIEADQKKKIKDHGSKSYTAKNPDNTTNEDVKYKEDIKANDKETPAKNLLEETKQINIKQTDLSTTALTAKKSDDSRNGNSVSKQTDEDNSSVESVRTRRLMETVLKKSLVILIEPLKSIHQPYLVKCNEDDIEPRKTRSRNENSKQKDSINKEGPSKEKITEKLETRKSKGTSESSRASDNNNKNESKKMLLKDEEMEQKSISRENTKNPETKAQEKIEEKSKSEKNLIKAKQKSDLKTEIKHSDSKESTDETASNKQCNEKKDLKTNMDISKNEEKETGNLKADKEGRDQLSEQNKSAEATNLEAKANKSKIENNKVEDEEKIACETSNFEPIKTRQNSDLKSLSNKSDTDSKENSDSLEHRIKNRQKSDQKTDAGSREIVGKNTACEAKSSERTQNRKRADLQTESNSTPTRTRQKPDLAKEIESAEKSENLAHTSTPTRNRQKSDLKTESESKEIVDENKEKSKSLEYRSTPVKTRQKSDPKTVSEGEEIPDGNSACEDKSSEGTQTRNRADLKTDSNKSEISQKLEHSSTPTRTRQISDLPKEIESTEKSENLALRSTPTRNRQKSDLKTETQNREIPDENTVCKERSSARTEIKDKSKSLEHTSTPTNKTRQKSDIKTESEHKEMSDGNTTRVEEVSSERTQTRKRTHLKAEAETKQKSGSLERSSTPIRTRQKSDLGTKTESKEKYEGNTTCEAKSSEQLQTSRNTDLKSEKSTTSKTLAKDKSDADIKSAKNNLEPNKSERNSDLKIESVSQVAAVAKIIDDESISDGIIQRTKEQNFEQPKTDDVLKTDLNLAEEKDICDEKTESKGNRKHVETIKTRQMKEAKKSKANDSGESFSEMRREPLKFKTGERKTSNEKTESKMLNSEPIKTSQKTDATKQTTKGEIESSDNKLGIENSSSEVKQNIDLQSAEICVEREKSDVKSDETGFEPIVTAQKPDSKMDKSEPDAPKVKSDEMRECEENTLKPIKTRQRSDLKSETKKSHIGQHETAVVCKDNISIEAQKTSEDKCAMETEEEMLEPIRTRSRIGLKCEPETGKEKISQNEISNVENADQSDSKDSKNSQRKTLNRDDEKSADQKETKRKEDEIEQPLKKLKPEEPVPEPIKTRRRGNIKEENLWNEKVDTASAEEPIKTRARGDVNKVESDKTKIELLQSKASENEKKESVDTINTRSHDNLKEETAIEKIQAQEASKESNGASEQKNIHQSSEVDDRNDKSKTLQQVGKSAEGKKHSLTPSRTRKTGNSKDVMKEISETSEREQVKTRGDLKGKNKKESDDEKVSENSRAATTENSVSKSQDVKDTNEKSTDEKSEETSTIQEEAGQQTLKSRITRNQVDIEIQPESDSKSIKKKTLVSASTKSETTQISKEDLQTDVQLLDSVKTRRGRADVKRKEPTKAPENKSSTSQNDKVVSTVDKEQTVTLNSQAPNDEAKQEEIIQQSTTLRIISEIDKIFQECSENEMSGFESSSSSTDNPIRRTLRKRGTDSPLSENEYTKKQFKEPPQKAVTHLTPKSTKTEKAVTNVSNASSKRMSRSPAPDTEIQSPAKKPKLEIQAKKSISARLRNIQDDGGLEEDPIKSSAVTGEQPQLIEKEKLNESATSAHKTAPNEHNKDVKGNSKDNVLLEKKGDEKVKGKKAPQSSANVLPEASLDIEATKQSTNADESPKSRADGNEAVRPTQLKASKTKLKTAPNKSPGSGPGNTSVLSFTEWLKAKSKSTPSESVTQNEDIPGNLKRQSRQRAKITLKSKDVIEKSAEVSPAPPAETAMILQANEKVPASPSKSTVELKKISDVSDINTTHEDVNTTHEDVTQQLDHSLLSSSENQLQNDSKEQKPKNRNKKAKVKLLQTPISKVNSPTSITPPKQNKSEIAMLIASMSKEMKDGGITDLLNTETRIKRQRLPNTKNLSLGAATPVKETVAFAAVGVKLSNFQQSDEIANTMTVPESVGYKNKSPTRRRAQQNVGGKSKKSSLIVHTDSTSRDSINTPDITALTEQSEIPEDPKTRKSLNITATKSSTMMDVIKTRKSMPLMPNESATLAKNTNLSPRKSLANSKKQQASDKTVFKVPMPTVPSNIPNKIPFLSADSVKRLYPGDKNLPDSRLKINQSEQNLLKKFKCRKIMVRLDRSVVPNFINSTNKRAQQPIKGAKRKSWKNARSADALKTIQNNSETNLLVQSVVDASTLINISSSSTAMQNTQDAHTNITPTIRHIQNSSTLVNIPQSASGSLTVPLVNESFELKNELMDENPVGSINEEILPDTPTLLARAQTITEAAHQALSNSATPTDIRLLPTDSTESNFVPSFGVTPTALDNRGTCMYTFLHPAKYNRNHSNVLLDYCCPNLDGPMPAIDPTRIHSQVQVPVIELPSCIVLTTKVVTRADLESGDTSIPAIIRKKAEKIRKNMATHHKMAVSAVNTLTSTSRPVLPPTINALTKQLPATTTITAKIRQPQPSHMIVNPSPPPQNVAPTLTKPSIMSVMPKGNMSHLSAVQQSTLRSNLRRFDVLLKQLVQPFETLSFVERHRIIEAVISSGKCLPRDLEQTLVLMEEYIKQTMLLKSDFQQTQPSVPAIMSTNNYASQPVVANPLPAAQMPQLQPSPKILASKAIPGTATSFSSEFEQSINNSVRKVPLRGRNLSSATTGAASVIQQRQVPIYDADRNIIGYQMQITPVSGIPAFTKPTMSPHTGAIMSTAAPDTSVSTYKINRKSLKRPAQDSPRIFYTTSPLKTSTPKAVTNSNIYTDPRPKTENRLPQKSQGSIVTTVRAPGSSSSASSETMTTTTMATVKRITRSTATGSKIIIVSKSNQSSEETILPDANSNPEQTEIKHEKDIEDFLG